LLIITHSSGFTNRHRLVLRNDPTGEEPGTFSNATGCPFGFIIIRVAPSSIRRVGEYDMIDQLEP